MARRFAGLSYSVGMENEQIQDEQAQVEAAQAEGGAENLETELIEVNDSAAEGEAREDAIEEAVEVVDGIEEDVEELEVAAENGGIDQYAASFLMRKTNDNLARIGMAPVRSVASESFGSASSRVRMTQVAMESLRDKARQVWEAIINAIKKAAKWIKGHFLKHFGAFEKLEGRAKALQEKAANTTGKAEESKFENDRLAAALHVERNITFAGIKDSLDIAVNVVSSYGKLESATASVVEEVDAIDSASGIASVADKMETVIKVVEGAASASDNVTDAKEKKNHAAAEGAELKASKPLAGGVKVYISRPNDSDKVPAHYKATVAKKQSDVDVSGKALSTLQPSQAEQLAAVVEELAIAGKNSRKATDKLGDLKEKLVKKVEKLAQTAGKVEAGDDNGAGGQYDDDSARTANTAERSAAKSARRTAVAIDKLVGNFPAKFNDYALTTAKAALDYVELSLRQYKKD